MSDERRYVVGQLAGPGTYRCTVCGREREEFALSFEIEACDCGNIAFDRID
jgi:hypothetical protein